jgi:hypothetical protein
VPNLTRADLRAFLPQYDLPDQQTDIVILLVRGWLLDATDLEVLPDPLPEVLWGAAVELAALLASNPESLAQKTIGPTSRSWPLAPRRDAILERLRKRYARQRMAPQGAYGPVAAYPEPNRYARTQVPATVPAGWYEPTGDGGWTWVGP